MLQSIRKYAALSICYLLIGCLNRESYNKQITIEGFPVIKGRLLIEKFNVEANRYEKIDSLDFANELVQQNFTIIDTANSTFRVRVKNSLLSIPFVFDKQTIKLKVDFGRPNNYSFDNSPLNNSIKKVLKQNNADSILAFMDTVSNAGAFMLLFKQSIIQESKQKELLSNAIKRFPNHKGINSIYNQFINYETILEKEFLVGQQIPIVSLPDENGNMYSTASLNGKPYMLFFWSTWCNQCNDYFTQINRLKQNGTAKGLDVVTIALDSQKDDWMAVIKHQQFAAKKLIDVNMWNGTTANTFYIDSIPFNFLVSDKGLILAKAIQPKHIADTISKYFP